MIRYIQVIQCLHAFPSSMVHVQGFGMCPNWYSSGLTIEFLNRLEICLPTPLCSKRMLLDRKENGGERMPFPTNPVYLVLLVIPLAMLVWV